MGFRQQNFVRGKFWPNLWSVARRLPVMMVSFPQLHHVSRFYICMRCGRCRRDHPDVLPFQFADDVLNLEFSCKNHCVLASESFGFDLLIGDFSHMRILLCMSEKLLRVKVSVSTVVRACCADVVRVSKESNPKTN